MGIKVIHCKKAKEAAKDFGLTTRRIYQLVKNNYLDALPLNDDCLASLPLEEDSIVIEVNHKYKMLLEIYGDKNVKRRNLKNRISKSKK